ncbi:hypothetical protein QR680_011986 [Steinernema hermaphroditum]|uniref:Peptidase A1 domain-containing protein n=1 Tax=Steinernema hermaphroditum TaxID=289476 RepID=A0AA39LZQ3_9BILA|nr:hypothetical protein QR680_011986 [Steinernema hermaphroditum]
MKSIVLVALLGLCAAFYLPDGQYPVKVHRTDPARLSKHYHHPAHDFYFITLEVLIGTPPQFNSYLIDTTHGDLEVRLCAHNPPTDADYACFNAAKSSTFKRVNDHIARDTIQTTGPFPTPNVSFAIVSPNSYKDPSEIAGTIGLGWGSKYPGETSFTMDYLADRPKFSIVSGNDQCITRVGFGIGANCTGNQLFQLATTSTRYWQIDFDGFGIGSVIVKGKGQAVIDTTREYIGMPKKYLEQFADAYQIDWSDEYGAYTVDCDRAYTLPSLKFSVDGGPLVIAAQQYVYSEKKLPNGQCVLSFEDSKANGSGPEWYFGIQIITEYCMIFDYEQKTMSFYKDPMAIQCPSHA